MKIFSKIEKYLYAFILLLVSLLTQDHHSSARQVNGNNIPQQNGSLPVLSERANGVNSRYLSAASTASLAAATVAASNGGSQSVSNQDANKNFLLHQQQQQQLQQQQQQQQLQQQQQQQQTNIVSSNQQANQAVVGQQQPQQQQVAVPANVNQALQFNSAQPQQVIANTPVMSTTFTFNPITGQFVPSDLTTGSLLSPSLSGSNYNQFVSGHQQQQQQQQPLSPFLTNNAYVGQTGSSFSMNPYAQQQQKLNQGFQQTPAGLNGNQFAYNQLQNGGGVNLNQFVNQQRQGSQFIRRNGYGTSASSSRFNNNAYGQQQQIQPIEDDSAYFQQQIASTGGLINDLNSFGVESSYGNSPSNSYLASGNNHHHTSSQQLQQQQQQLQQTLSEHPISSQASSVSSVILPTTSFNTAFNGPIPSSSEYKNDQCVAADNRHGTCYQASECIKKGGTPMGKCGGNSNEFSGSSYVCCLFDITCGQFAAERFVYFRNPNYPNTYDQSRMCRAKIGKLDKGVCQFRLDLLRFDVAKPTNGNCSNDMFVVSGQNENYVIPKICGLNDGQHYYVGVDESGVITLHMMMMGFYRRSFEILITQIPCRSDYAAPAHCLQYYMGTHGTIKSFNYDDEHLISQQTNNYDLLQQANQQDGSVVNLRGPTAPYGLQFNGNGQLQQRQQLSIAANAAASGPSRFGLYTNGGHDQYGGYPNDLDYTMCIRKESGFCSITYQLSRSEQGLQPFAVGYSLFGSNDSLLAHLNGQSANWQPVSTECRDDYLLIGGVRLCSGVTNQFPLPGSPFDTSASIQFAHNGSILNSAGINQPSMLNQQQLQQQLQSQHNLLSQQLARLQQQQQQAAGNVSYSNSISSSNNNGNNNSASNLAGQQQQTGNIVNNNNLEQQQAAIMHQQSMLIQQLNLLAANNGGIGSNTNNNFINQNNRYQQYDGQFYDTQGAIITDTTSGPFILRFVSNMARNARGFQIDYRQNPCK